MWKGIVALLVWAAAWEYFWVPPSDMFLAVPIAPIAAAAIGALGAFLGNRGEDAPELDPEIKESLRRAIDLGNQQELLVNPNARRLLGVNADDLSIQGAVPLREAANQLAFALLPNFVRGPDTLFPGIGPGFGANPNAATPVNRTGTAFGGGTSVGEQQSGFGDLTENELFGKFREFAEQRRGGISRPGSQDDGQENPFAGVFEDSGHVAGTPLGTSGNFPNERLIELFQQAIADGAGQRESQFGESLGQFAPQSDFESQLPESNLRSVFFSMNPNATEADFIDWLFRQQIGR